MFPYMATKNIRKGSLVRIRMHAASGALRTRPVTSQIRYRVTEVSADQITIEQFTQTGFRKEKTIRAAAVVHVYN